ncbi:uncharacterized protein FPRO_03425 [Fusarium proliferatum ET1]|uniref:Uncharacterized protein n=1 Tax=Fusarium proliferatum (strain ET1) TaxID=1227346 RepID=A0A1L7VAA2_FUSPR|nr:uncharacterized protein FPRO_03425 [Fusarium proliferatum ET1]CZR36315.1 uncharacterized protein FPRO_03425 [Fusarium proliferatum ET1]
MCGGCGTVSLTTIQRIDSTGLTRHIAEMLDYLIVLYLDQVVFTEENRHSRSGGMVQHHCSDLEIRYLLLALTYLGTLMEGVGNTY